MLTLDGRATHAPLPCPPTPDAVADAPCSTPADRAAAGIGPPSKGRGGAAAGAAGDGTGDEHAAGLRSVAERMGL